MGDGVPEKGLAKSGQKFAFHYALPVDASGELPRNGGIVKFADIRDFKRLLLDDEKQVARNLARQLAVYATGAPVRFSDRAQIEQVLENAERGTPNAERTTNHYGVRSLIHGVVQSDLFLNK
jgi:hypothetical protein